MNGSSEESPTETRERLEARANVVRSRLVSRLDALSDQRDRVSDVLSTVKEQAARHRGLLIGISAGALLLVGFVAYRRRVRARHDPRYVVAQLVARVLGPAYVVEAAEQKPGLVGRTLKKALMAAAVSAANQFGKQALGVREADTESAATTLRSGLPKPTF